MSSARRGWAVAVMLLGVSLCAACSRGGEDGKMNSAGEQVVRRAVGGGRWFPGTREQLEALVEGFILEAKTPPVTGRIVGAIAPHAGYQYSGKIAGCAFRAIRDNAKQGGAPETVVILGFSHQAGFGWVAIMDGDAIETPLRKTPLDKEAGRTLTEASPLIRFDYRPHAGEHSAENEIPFAQAAAPDAKLVVGLLGNHEPATLDALVAALGELAKKKRILVVASTDLLHDYDYDLVRKTDQTTMDQIAALDSGALLRRWSGANQVCCGIGPVVTVLRFAAAQGCKQGAVLCAGSSADTVPYTPGAYVVGYGAAVFASPE